MKKTCSDLIIEILKSSNGEISRGMLRDKLIEKGCGAEGIRQAINKLILYKVIECEGTAKSRSQKIILCNQIERVES